MPINSGHLRAFHGVAREGSFTRAAAALDASQSNLSGQVKALEARWDLRLFERKGRGVALTDMGRQLYAIADRLFAVEAEAEALLAGARAPKVARLKVSADNPFNALVVMAEFKRRQPSAVLSLASGNSEAVLKDLENYRADIAMTARETSDERLFALPFRRDRLVLFVARNHAWAKRRRVGFAELAGQDVVLRESGSVTRAVFERARAAAGIALGSVMDIEGREAVREAVAAGFGVGVVFAREFVPDERVVPLAVPDADLDVGEWVVCLAERRRLPGVRLFMDIARALADA